MPVLARAGDLDDFAWTQFFTRADQWTPQPTWLSNASSTATVTIVGRTACFAVDEPGRGMKWSARPPAVWLADLPYLSLRYRAENLDTSQADYFVYLDDGRPGKQFHALRLCDVISDGQWHVVSVDLSELSLGESVTGMAIQVRTGSRGKGRLWLDWLSFQDIPPKDATILRQTPRGPAKPDWPAPLRTLS
jgi:hypothetical protein